MGGLTEGIGGCPAVVPVLIGPLQVLLTILPGLLLALGGGVLALLKPSGMKNALRLLWQQRLAVFCVLLVGAALYFGTRLLWPTGQADTVTASQSGADWPMARFDLRRCGVAPGSRSPTRAQLVWSYQQGREWYLASPAVVGNRLYIATADVRLSKSGAILCLDADTGAPVWTSSVPDYRPTFSSPVVVGDYLVIGEGLHDTRDARVICLDRRDSEKGKVVWTFRTANHVECTPVVANGRVYVGAGDDGVYCLDLQPDADGQAKVHWHKSPDQFRDAETSLAVHDGKVYVGLGNDGKALVVLDALSGAELHRIDMPYPVFSPAAIADGKLYLGMGEGDYVKDGDGGAVVCLDLARLTSDWTFALPKTVLGAVAIKDDRLYFGCGDGQLYCLSRAGKLIKAFDTRAPIKTSPAVTDEHVFVVNSAGVLYALDRHSLEPVWDYRLAASDLFISSPVVARGHVYVGTQAEGLVCVGQPPTTQRTPQWAAPLGGAGVAGNSDGSSLPDEGEIHWVYGGGRGAKVAAPVAVWENHLYVPLADTDRPGIDCLPLPKERREPPQALWHFRTDAGVWSSPVVLGKVVGAVDGRPGETRTLYLMDRDWGVLVARQPVAAEATGLLTTTGHQFLVQDQADVLTSLDPAGRRQWNAVVGRLACPPAANEAMILAVAAAPSQVLALDRATGVELWRTALTSPASAAPILEKKSFLLATARGLERRSLLDGQILTTFPVEAGIPSGELAVSNAVIVYVNQRGEVVTIDRAAGTMTRVAGALPGQTPLVSRGQALVAAEGRLMTVAVGHEHATPELWVDLSALVSKAGLPVGPLVLIDSRVVTVLPGRGLCCLGGPR